MLGEAIRVVFGLIFFLMGAGLLALAIMFLFALVRPATDRRGSDDADPYPSDNWRKRRNRIASRMSAEGSPPSMIARSDRWSAIDDRPSSYHNLL